MRENNKVTRMRLLYHRHTSETILCSDSATLEASGTNVSLRLSWGIDVPRLGFKSAPLPADFWEIQLS